MGRALVIHLCLALRPTPGLLEAATMTNIDQFESVFKAADKTVFSMESVQIETALVVTGLEQDAHATFDGAVRTFLGSLAETLDWQSLGAGDFDQVEPFLELIEQVSPDLVCTYRNLQTPAYNYPYSLGVFVEVLTQATEIPVLLLPRPDAAAGQVPPRTKRNAVMAITDHLTGDHHLVSHAAFFTAPEGTLYLSHVEDQATFDRYLNVISKISEIDTETARVTIREQLLKEPGDYIHSSREVLGQSVQHLQVEEIIALGQHLIDYRRLVDEHAIDLLVMNTKDEDQQAMHGLTYPLAVELRDTPLLLL